MYGFIGFNFNVLSNKFVGFRKGKATITVKPSRSITTIGSNSDERC
jgi:hypothetical protein